MFRTEPAEALQHADDQVCPTLRRAGPVTRVKPVGQKSFDKAVTNLLGSRACLTSQYSSAHVKTACEGIAGRFR